jgi:glycosyltransferase involved in cell wall biosynthesis
MTKIGIHITHEAVQKIGGIGSVINGLCTADRYKSFFEKTVLYGPLFSTGGDVSGRLGKGGEVLYSNHDNFDAGRYHTLFCALLVKYSIDIVYGRRTLVNEFNVNKKNVVEVILVNIDRMNLERVNAFKYALWERFAIESDRYNDWDYEQYVRIGALYPDILGLLYPNAGRIVHFAHEYMGIPSALAVTLTPHGKAKHTTIFYAHEIPPCRAVVENNPGHDISFYHRMRENRKLGRSFEDEHGSQKASARSELVKRSRHLDYVFAVSDLIREEYLYFVPDADERKVRVVFNGIPLRYIAPEEKLARRRVLQTYISNLFNFTPDVIFTHVTRLVLSKGIWRDITFLYVLDELFQRDGLKGAYILLSTLVGTGREPREVASMEREYGWPVVHREGWPDLVGTERDIYTYLSLFNARSRNVKGVFLNQFGFSRRKCGSRVPEEAEFIDLRVGSDAEFGFSIYEPFGIAQLEAVPFGGMAALSSSCGCSSFLEKCLDDSPRKNFVVFPFADGRADGRGRDLASLTTEQRFEMERELFREAGPGFFRMLPKSDEERLQCLRAVQNKLECLGWESVVHAMSPATL